MTLPVRSFSHACIGLTGVEPSTDFFELCRGRRGSWT